MLKKLLAEITQQRMVQKQAELYSKLLRHEAKIGGTIFGPVEPGGRREFFCLDPTTWVWHEEWIDQFGQHQAKTTRYDVRPTGVFKVQDGQYYALSEQELHHLISAAQTYQQRVEHELYSFAV
ncbi:hypothetical protein CR970_02725 [Candidatus Saccharibacteria bacterium]|nr:MAG: hypothetical protein CR970_02725 [Candidatus Saccharibacteria bacterium]